MRPLLLLGIAGAVFAQGTTPKPAPEDYPVHGQARSAVVGAEFMVHSFSAGEQTYIVKGYLVLEVALYPPKGQNVDVHSGNFVLHMNGRKQEFLPQSPSVVAATLAHPEWADDRRLTVDGQAGPVGISTGQTRPAQIPGMPIPGQPTPLPRAPRDNPSGLPPREQVQPAQLLLDSALPQGEHHGPVSGFLYFAYSGKISAIKSLELRYEDVTLKLR
jgi:hypothetical protein